MENEMAWFWNTDETRAQVGPISTWYAIGERTVLVLEFHKIHEIHKAFILEFMWFLKKKISFFGDRDLWNSYGLILSEVSPIYSVWVPWHEANIFFHLHIFLPFLASIFHDLLLPFAATWLCSVVVNPCFLIKTEDRSQGAYAHQNLALYLHHSSIKSIYTVRSRLVLPLPWNQIHQV